MDNFKTIISLAVRVLISIVLIAVFLWGGWEIFLTLKAMKKEPEQAAAARPKTAVKVQRVRREDFQEYFSGYGLARSLRSTDVEAEVSGIVKWISPKLEAGQAIEADEELVRIDDRDLAETVAEARASLTQTEAAVEALNVDEEGINRQLVVAREELEVAKRELERLNTLLKTGKIPPSTVDKQVLLTTAREREVLELEWREKSQRPAMERAAAEISERKSQLAKAQNGLARTVILAPFAGRVVQRYIQPGARTGPGKPLFRLVDLSNIEVPISLGASHFREVKIGADASLQLHENGASVWQGEVARISPTVNSADRTFTAFFEVQGHSNGSSVPPGAFVLATIAGPVHKDVFVVPRSAFIGEKLFVAERSESSGGEAIIHERHPKVKKFLPDLALVKGGLEPGDEVVVTSVEEIDEGSRVVVVEEDDEGESEK